MGKLINCKRVAFALLKTLIYIIAFFSLAWAIHTGINNLALSEDRRQKTGHRAVVKQDDSGGDEGNTIAIIVGTASVLMAVLTMLQQHITRYQDRALAFPKMILKECKLYIGENTVEKNTSFYNDKGGKLLIKIDYKEAFASCYVPCIYRVKVAENPYGSTGRRYLKLLCKFLGKQYCEEEYLKILNHFSSCGKNELSIEAVCDESKLVKEYCEKQQGTEDYKLKLVLDVCWKNELLMYGLRNMSKMYLRYEIGLDNSQRSRPEDNCYIFNIENFNMKGVPFWL